MAQSAFVVVKAVRCIFPVIPEVGIVCDKINFGESTKMGETVMLAAAGEWRERITEAINFTVDKFNSHISDKAYGTSDGLDTVLAQAVVAYFVPEGCDPAPDEYCNLLQQPLQTAIRAAKLCSGNPLVAEFIREVGVGLPCEANELLDRAVQLTRI
jgi:hypothetical protein